MLEPSNFTKNQPLNKHFSSILTVISPGNCIFNNTCLSQSILNGSFRYRSFSCSMIQKIIKELLKLRTIYFLNGGYYYLHIYSKGYIRGSCIKDLIPISNWAYSNLAKLPWVLRNAPAPKITRLGACLQATLILVINSQ